MIALRVWNWRPLSIHVAVGWLVVVVAAAAFAPLLANHRPLWVASSGGLGSSPALMALSPVDLVGIASAVLGITAALGWAVHRNRSRLARHFVYVLAGLAGGLVVISVALPVLETSLRRDVSPWIANWRTRPEFAGEVAVTSTALVMVPVIGAAILLRRRRRFVVAVGVGVVLAGLSLSVQNQTTGGMTLGDQFGQPGIVWALVAYSPQVSVDSQSLVQRAPPGAALAKARAGAILASRPMTVEALRDIGGRVASSELDADAQAALQSVVSEIAAEGQPVSSKEVISRYKSLAGFCPLVVSELVESTWRGPLGSPDQQPIIELVGHAQGLSSVQRSGAISAVVAAFAAPQPIGQLTGTALAERIAVAIGPRSQLGTDSQGYDVAAQMIHGARTAIGVGVLATALALCIGIPLGAIMGWRGGLIDLLGMRLIEIFRSIPGLLLVIVAAAVLPKTVVTLVVMLALYMWTGAAKFVRAEFLRIRELDYVAAARAAGVGEFSVVTRHMLPGALSPVIVNASFAVGAMIVFESTLSYLGLGPSGVASWGSLLSQAIDSSHQFHWWLAVPPGAAIFLTVYALNAVGEYARERLDPRLAG